MSEISRIEYQKNGDYQIPNLTLGEVNPQPIGKYGRMRKNYLQEHRPILYNRMILNGQLQNHLLETEQTAQRRLDQMMTELKATNGVTEQLKAENQLKWIGLMNNLKQEAEETILTELIFA